MIQNGPMDILVQTLRKEGVLALWKGKNFSSNIFRYSVSMAHNVNYHNTNRHGEPAHWHSRSQLASIHFVRRVETDHLPVPGPLPSRNRCGGCDGWCC